MTRFGEQRPFIAAIKKAGIKRVLWVGGAGGLEVKPGVRVVDSPELPSWVRPGSLATINALDQLQKNRNFNGPISAPQQKSSQTSVRESFAWETISFW